MSLPKEDGAGRRLPAEQLGAVEARLEAQPWLFRLPSGLRQGFARRREAEFARLVGLGTPLLLLMYISLLLAGYLVFSFEIDGVDRRLWWQVQTLAGGVMVAGLLLGRWRRLLSHYLLWVGLMALSLLSAKLYLVITLSSPRLAQAMSYDCMLVIIVVVLALRLTVGVAALVCLGAGVLAYGAARVQGVYPDISMLIFYFLGAVLVCLFVAALLDRQERINYLQALLLEHRAAEHGRLNEQLARMARQDQLSGLSNRRHFDEVLAEEWERARREKQELALLFLDVDHFKAYNDHYGHPAGDACLSQIGVALSSSLLRPADMAARYGGEEFVVLLPATGLQGARQVAERVLAAVDSLGIPHETSVVAPHVTVSLGLAALRPDQWPHAKTLIDTADEALYEAKRRGRHCIVERNPLGLPVV